MRKRANEREVRTLALAEGGCLLCRAESHPQDLHRVGSRHPAHQRVLPSVGDVTHARTQSATRCREHGRQPAYRSADPKRMAQSLEVWRPCVVAFLVCWKMTARRARCSSGVPDSAWCVVGSSLMGAELMARTATGAPTGRTSARDSSRALTSSEHSDEDEAMMWRMCECVECVCGLMDARARQQHDDRDRWRIRSFAASRSLLPSPDAIGGDLLTPIWHSRAIM